MLFSKLSRYLMLHVLGGILLGMLVLISLDSLSRIIEQGDSIRGDYNFLSMLYYIGITIPGRIVAYMPYAALIGSLVGMGLLANNNELVVMRSAGLSMYRLIGMCLIPVTVLMLLAMLASEFLIPKLDRVAEQTRLEQRYGGLSGYHGKRQFWNREGNEFMRVKRLGVDGNILGLTRYVFDSELRLTSSQYAQTASFDDGQWTMHKIRETRINHTDFSISTHQYETKPWSTKIEPRLLEYLILDPMELNIVRIARFTDYLEEQNLNTKQYALAFWQKLFYPLTAISLVLVVISGIFGSIRQKSVGYRIFVGVVVGVLFRMLQNTITPVAMVYDLSPLFASAFPVLLCLAIGFYRLHKVH